MFFRDLYTMKRSIFVVLVFCAFFLISFVPQSEGKRIAVSYPPNTKDLVIEEGSFEEVEVHLYNKSENKTLRANLKAHRFENVNLSFDKGFKINPKTMEEAIIRINADQKTRFSGEVRIAFEEVEMKVNGKNGGKLAAGSSIPISGEFLGGVEEKQDGDISRGILFVILSVFILVCISILVLKNNGNKDSNASGSSYKNSV